MLYMHYLRILPVFDGGCRITEDLSNLPRPLITILMTRWWIGSLNPLPPPRRRHSHGSRRCRAWGDGKRICLRLSQIPLRVGRSVGRGGRGGGDFANETRWRGPGLRSVASPTPPVTYTAIRDEAFIGDSFPLCPGVPNVQCFLFTSHP